MTAHPYSKTIKITSRTTATRYVGAQLIEPEKLIIKGIRVQ